MKNTLKEAEKQVTTTEVRQIKELLLKYDIVLKDGIGEKELIFKYETFHDQPNGYTINKRKEIVDVEVMINSFSRFSNNDNFNTIMDKKKKIPIKLLIE